jgi:hypothetical protein
MTSRYDLLHGKKSLGDKPISFKRPSEFGVMFCNDCRGETAEEHKCL